MSVFFFLLLLLLLLLLPPLLPPPPALTFMTWLLLGQCVLINEDFEVEAKLISTAWTWSYLLVFLLPSFYSFIKFLFIGLEIYLFILFILTSVVRTLIHLKGWIETLSALCKANILPDWRPVSSRLMPSS